MQTRIQIVAILVTAGMFLVVFELVRRRRLMERYALIWLFSTAVLLALAVWKQLLEKLASAVGIYYAPSALFAVAFAAVLLLLLHFSLVISRLVDQNKVLAQQLGILRERVAQLEQSATAVEQERAEASEPSEQRISTLG
jgi:hypothetical protein